MSNNWYPCSDLTGGGDGALDALDGAAIVDGDRAFVISSGEVAFYILNATSAATEISPHIISPDSNADSKRWILTGSIPGSFLEFEYYNSTYPITTGEQAAITLLDSFARGKNHTISPKVSAGLTAISCAILSGDSNSITEISTGLTVVCGGLNNSVLAADKCIIGGGSSNYIEGTGDTINCTICGGLSNYIEGDEAGAIDGSTICGGMSNYIDCYGMACFVGGGSANYIEGNALINCDYCTICGGKGNSIYGSGNDHTISGGKYNEISASGDGVFIGGGLANEVAGQYGVVAGGKYNEVSADYGYISGGTSAIAYLYGQSAQSTGIQTSGKSQVSNLVCGNSTTDATITELFLDSSHTERAVLPDSRMWKFTVDLAAMQTGGTSGTVGDSAFWTITGGIKRDSADNTVLVGTPQGAGVPGANDRDVAAAAWSISVVADDTNESLKIAVTGEIDKSVNWVAKISLVEVG